MSGIRSNMQKKEGWDFLAWITVCMLKYNNYYTRKRSRDLNCTRVIIYGHDLHMRSTTMQICMKLNIHVIEVLIIIDIH